MARGDPTYAHIDVTWPDDPRSQVLSAAENWLYELCVLAAVAARRNCLPPAYSVSYFCRRCAQRRSTWNSLIQKSAQTDPAAPILWVNPEGRICVTSIGKRHPKLYWKDDREGPFPAPHGDGMGPISAPRPSVRPSVRSTTPTPGSCTKSGEKKSDSESRLINYDKDVPLAPLFKIQARAAGVDLGAVIEAIVLAKGRDLQKWYGWLLVVEEDVRSRQGTSKEIKSPTAWYRTLCKRAELPTWAVKPSKDKINRYRLKTLPKEQLDELRDLVKAKTPAAKYRRRCKSCGTYWPEAAEECPECGKRGWRKETA